MLRFVDISKLMEEYFNSLVSNLSEENLDKSLKILKNVKCVNNVVNVVIILVIGVVKVKNVKSCLIIVKDNLNFIKIINTS